ncbi:MAG: hypothetical protein KF736_14005 [Acidobacteria bacterium]|nr:hypothetical protein [Acidobacteriota bacterium]MCW5950286.1 hypothetical protein [Pyrinomonadaceae bacterium]
MNIDELRRTLAWSTVINYVILIVWFTAFTLAHGTMLEIHSRWFRLSADHFDALNYLLIGFYKTLVLVFNLVPYLALRIIKKRR